MRKLALNTTMGLILAAASPAFGQSSLGAGPPQLSPEAQAKMDELNQVLLLGREFLLKGEYEKVIETLDPLMDDEPFAYADRLYGDALIRLGRVSQSLRILARRAKNSSHPNMGATLYGYALAVTGNLSGARSMWDWYVANTWGRAEDDFTDWPGLKTQSDLIARFALATSVDISYGSNDLARAFYLEKAIEAAPKSAMVQLAYGSFNTYPTSLDPNFYRERIKHIQLAKQYAILDKTRHEAGRVWTYLVGTAYRLGEAERARKRLAGGG